MWVLILLVPSLPPKGPNRISKTQRSPKQRRTLNPLMRMKQTCYSVKPNLLTERTRRLLCKGPQSKTTLSASSRERSLGMANPSDREENSMAMTQRSPKQNHTLSLLMRVQPCYGQTFWQRRKLDGNDEKVPKAKPHSQPRHANAALLWPNLLTEKTWRQRDKGRQSKPHSHLASAALLCL